MVNKQQPSLDTVFQALADPIRRGIVSHLARGEASVGDLSAPYRVTAPSISRHLRVLQGAGFISRRKQGRIHHCRLNPRPMIDAARWIVETRQFWEHQFDALAKYLNQMDTKEEQPWQHPQPSPAPRSASAAPTTRRAKKSSPRGPKRGI